MSVDKNQIRRPSQRAMHVDELSDDDDNYDVEKQRGIPSKILTPVGGNYDIQQKRNINENKKINIKHVDLDDTVSTITEISSIGSATVSQKLHKKLLSGFHPYHDEETDMMALQCSTCCIGSWRNCSSRCTGCENFLSFPIYCWCGCLVPFLFCLLVGVGFTASYATGIIG